MSMRKLFCMVMAMLLALGTMALAETDDLQAQLDAANARIAELEAEVELYKPYYENQIVAEYGEDGIIWLEDAQEEYQAASDAYAQYGLNIEDYAEGIKQDILESLVRQSVLDEKAAELGLDQLDDEARANLEAEAEANFETYVETYKTYFAAEDATDEEAREQTIEAMAQYGLTQEALTEQMLESYVDEQLHSYITQDVTVTDEDIQAEYDQMVEDDEALYADDDYSYNSARNSGETIAWNPEGYRAVKHVLIKFDDEQAAQYNELQNTLDSLKAEKDAAENPVEETETEGDAEAASEPRAIADIDADIAEVTAEIEALHAQLLPQAQQVIDEFEGGADFQSLIEKYNEDPGMTNEPTASNGYAVAADSTTWDHAFTEGAMSIAEVGQISAPVYGMNGIHIIYYLSDITPGAVPFEEIAETAEANALEAKIADTYDAQVSAWVEEAAPVYYLDRF
ncbi:MAG: peptidylprolyl isomerase [Clostridia bacterium]|nr:peptidylprolyl isomerase [Clostridia bacterium]